MALILRRCIHFCVRNSCLKFNTVKHSETAFNTAMSGGNVSSGILLYCHRSLGMVNTYFQRSKFSLIVSNKCCVIPHVRSITSNHRDQESKKSLNNDTNKQISQDDNQANAYGVSQTRIKLKETADKFKEKFEETILKENIFTIPNFLCVTRIVLSPVLAYLILHQSYEFAFGLFVFAGVTDLLDGFIARNFKNQSSMFGSFLDPMADKFLAMCLFLSLTYINLIPVPLTSLIIARDVCLFGAGFYIRYLSLPPPKTLWRYFDATHATAQLSPTTISKVNTAVQLTLVACTLASPVFGFENEQCFVALWYLTAMTTILSGISYIYSNKTYQLLKNIKEKRSN